MSAIGGDAKDNIIVISSGRHVLRLLGNDWAADDEFGLVAGYVAAGIFDLNGVEASVVE